MKYLFYSIFFIGLFSSCMSSKETNLLQSLDISYPIQPYEEYRLIPGDVVSCVLYTRDPQYKSAFGDVISESQTTSKFYTVHDNGAISIPFFGDIKVSGYTLQEAENIIQNRMQESITDIQVSARLATNYFYVLSDGGQRGMFYIYKDNMTIFQAIALTGGTPSGRMDLSKVNILRRNSDGESVIKTFDLRTQDIIQSEYYYIQPNDLIYYPTSKKTFFNITSFGSLQSFITTIGSLAFLIFTASYKF